jgi:chromosome partitioning protein
MERIRRAGQSAREFFSAARAAIKKVERKRAPALAVWNAKGGVGKTSIAANLALCLAAFEKLQKRVLLIDLDPQHNLSQIILPQDDLEKIQGEEKTVVAAFEPTRFSGSLVSPLDDYTTIMAGANYRPPTAADLSWSGEHERLLGHFELICGDVGLAKYTMRHQPDRMQVCKDRFMEFMSLARQQYDIVLIDCNPSFSFLTECAVDSCSHIISPVTPDSFALRGLRALRNITQQAYATTVPEQIVLMNRIAANREPLKTEAILRSSAVFGPRTLTARLRQSNYLKTPEGDLAAHNPLSSLAYFRAGAGAAEVHSDLENVASELCHRLETQIN